MKRIVLVAACLTAFLLGGAPVALGDKLDLAKWSHLAPIEVPGHPVDGVISVALTPQLFDQALPGREDLRVVADGKEEIGYVIKETQAGSRIEPLEVQLYNRTYLPGRQSSVTVDFGTKVKKNQIEVQTGGTNFRRRVTIEGSDDGEKWQVVKGTAFLFRIPGENEQTTVYDRSLIPIPTNDQRYLRLIVFNGDGDDEQVTIEEVKAYRKTVIPPSTTAAPIASTESKHKKRTTEILLDLGHRNMPLYEIAFGFSDGNFLRRVTLFGRNSKSRVVRYPVEDSPAHEKTVKVPWSRIKEETLFRFSNSDDREESLTINLMPTQYRYLKAVIRNGDDSPLNFTGAAVTRLVKQLEFQPKRNSGYAVYVGNPKASRPTYDLSHYVERLRKEGVVQASLGNFVDNPAHKPVERQVPWSERYSWLIWIALVAMLVVLGLLVYRVAASAPRGNPS